MGEKNGNVVQVEEKRRKQNDFRAELYKMTFLDILAPKTFWPYLSMSINWKHGVAE